MKRVLSGVFATLLAISATTAFAQDKPPLKLGGILDMSGLAQKGGAVYSHIRIAKKPEDIHAIRVAAGECDLVLGGSPEQQLMAVFGGTAIRIIFVVGLGMILYQSLDEFHSSKFWLWIIIYYLATLTLEMILVVRRQSAMDRAVKKVEGGG